MKKSEDNSVQPIDCHVPDPSDFSNFRETVLTAATNFMSYHDVAKKMFRVSEHDFDEMCRKEFNGMSASALFEWCASVSDMKVRAMLRTLTSMGNQTATNIYTKYISKTQEEQHNNDIKVTVVNLPATKSDDDDDGGVHNN